MAYPAIEPAAPGDSITSTVNYVDPEQIITVTDNTTGQTVTHELACAGCGHFLRKVEVAVVGYGTQRSPKLGNLPESPVGNYGKVRFTGIAIHDNHGKTGGFTKSNWKHTKFTAEAHPTVSRLGVGGASFTDTWK